MGRTGFDRRDLLAIAVGGVSGAALRWWITRTGSADDGHWLSYESAAGQLAVAESAIPWRTLAVNLLGTALLGFIVAVRSAHPDRRLTWLATGTGFCGSLTTFSTLAVELATRIRGGTGPFTSDAPLGTSLFAMEHVEAPPVMVDYAWSLTPIAAGLLYLSVTVIAGAATFVLGRRLGRLIAPLPPEAG